MDSKLEEFRAHLADLERAPGTIESYITAVKQFYDRYDVVNKENMIDYKQWQLDTRKPKTAALRCIGMNVYLDFIGMPECRVKGIRLPRRTTVENVISHREYRRFLDCLQREGNDKMYFMVKFLAGTGCRASELIKLEKSCLETGEFTLWTKGKIRRILIPKSLIEESRSYFSGVDSSYLFPNRFGEKMSTGGVSCQLKKYGRKYGIREEVLHPHAFRHLFAILFLKQNKNIALLSDVLGHESLNTTAIYLRLSAEEQKRQFNRTVNW